jgi:hypothetical protein
MHEKKNYRPISVFYFFNVSYGATNVQARSDLIYLHFHFRFSSDSLQQIYFKCRTYKCELKDLPPLFSTNTGNV